MKLISSLMPKMISCVLLESCIDLAVDAASCSLRFCGSLNSTTYGPSGQNVSKLLRAHPLAVGELQVARRDVVGDRVAAHVGRARPFSETLARLARR